MLAEKLKNITMQNSHARYTYPVSGQKESLQSHHRSAERQPAEPLPPSQKSLGYSCLSNCHWCHQSYGEFLAHHKQQSAIKTKDNTVCMFKEFPNITFFFLKQNLSFIGSTKLKILFQNR